MRDRLKRLIGIAILVVAVPIAAGLAHVLIGSWGHVHELDEAPARPTAIVLGAKADPTGPSAFLAARLDLAIDLYEAGKVETILVSGDGRPPSNNEPLIMRRYLEERDIPADAITEDPGGYDTYDTCKRARDNYGVSEATVLTQDFHLRRAVTICRALGIETDGVADTAMLGRWPGAWLKGAIREPFANIKMWVDLVSDREPAAGNQ